jgi:uncharacterized protein (DUF983 family)
MSEENKKKCKECGVDMNHNAEKIDYTGCLDDPDSIDPDLGGILEEVYTCPECGKTDMFKMQPGQS